MSECLARLGLDATGDAVPNALTVRWWLRRWRVRRET